MIGRRRSTDQLRASDLVARERHQEMQSLLDELRGRRPMPMINPLFAEGGERRRLRWSIGFHTQQRDKLAEKVGAILGAQQ